MPRRTTSVIGSAVQEIANAPGPSSPVRVLSDYPTAMVGVRRLTVRALPTSASAAQGVLQMGDEVEVMAASADGAWFNVRFGAMTGWIYAESTLKY